MRTRSGVCYGAMEVTTPSNKKGRREHDDHAMEGRKRIKVSPRFDFFDALPDDLLVCIISNLAASACCPADFASLLITCKRFNGLGLHPMVLAKASPKVFALQARNWSDCAHHLFMLCADAGNVEACYTLGMIRFYCLQNRSSGASLMAKAAIASHAQALYSLAVIQFNGSGGYKIHKDLRAGVALCARAAFLGHVDALRELGHCLQDGYGVRQDVSEGRRFLVQANARELAHATKHGDFGGNISPPEVHPVSQFLRDWFANSGGDGDGQSMCSHAECGRRETRMHEFRRCSVCGKVNYCSRACQALHWNLRHKADCAPTDDYAVAVVPGGQFLGVAGAS